MTHRAQPQSYYYYLCILFNILLNEDPFVMVVFWKKSHSFVFWQL